MNPDVSPLCVNTVRAPSADSRHVTPPRERAAKRKRDAAILPAIDPEWRIPPEIEQDEGISDYLKETNCLLTEVPLVFLDAYKFNECVVVGEGRGGILLQ